MHLENPTRTECCTYIEWPDGGWTGDIVAGEGQPDRDAITPVLLEDLMIRKDARRHVWDCDVKEAQIRL